MFLPDVNVLLALAFDAHEHHPLAVQWLSSVADGEAIVGGLRVVTFDGAFASIPEVQSLVLGA